MNEETFIVRIASGEVTVNVEKTAEEEAIVDEKDLAKRAADAYNQAVDTLHPKQAVKGVEEL